MCRKAEEPNKNDVVARLELETLKVKRTRKLFSKLDGDRPFRIESIRKRPNELLRGRGHSWQTYANFFSGKIPLLVSSIVVLAVGTLPISRYSSSPFALSPQFRQTVGTHDGPSVRIRFTHDDVVASGYEAWTSAASRRGQYQVLNFFVQSRTIVVETVKNLDECRRDETGIIRQEFRSCNEYSHFCGNRSVTFSPFERFFPLR